MPSAATVKRDLPSLAYDPGLVPVGERLEWRDALSYHILAQMQSQAGEPLPEWKLEESVIPMTQALRLLVEQGVTAPCELQDHFVARNNSRNEYATNQ